MGFFPRVMKVAQLINNTYTVCPFRMQFGDVFFEGSITPWGTPGIGRGARPAFYLIK